MPYGLSAVYFNHVWTACGSTKTQLVQRFTFSSLIPFFAHKFLALFSYFWINHSQQVLIVLSLSSVCVVIEVLGFNVGCCYILAFYRKSKPAYISIVTRILKTMIQFKTYKNQCEKRSYFWKLTYLTQYTFTRR